MKNSIAVLFLSLFIVSIATAGGPWTQQKGKGYYKLSEWWLTYNQHYTDTGATDPNITTGIFNTSLYAEYGFTDRLTGVIYAPLFSRNYYNNQVSNTTGEVIIQGESLNSVGDFDVSIKYGLTQPGAKIPIAVTLTLGLPLGQTGQGALNILQTGDGEFNQMIQFDAGTSFQFGNINVYSSATIGFNNRTKGFSEEFRYGYEIGAGLMNQKLWLIGRLGGVESFQNGALTDPNTSTSIFANNSEFTSFGIEAAYYVTKQFGVSASFASAFRGRIIAAAPSYSIGVFYDLSK
ncbi:MAG: hypothetical protein P1U56_04270 [Saprospiraceae bacterium]|nr:hypothetical protein [Saprospiraceae bacterium]